MNEKDSKSESKAIDESVTQIELKVENLLKEIKSIEKFIRIEEKKCQTNESDLKEEEQKYEDICKRVDDNRRLNDNLLEEINRKSKYGESLQQTNKDSDQMIISLDNELKRKSEELNKQKSEFKTIVDEYVQRYHNKEDIYGLLASVDNIRHSTQVSDSDHQLVAKQNQLKDIDEELSSIECQFNQLQQSNSSNTRMTEVMDLYMDPIRVIVEMAKLKVNSNLMQENKELIQREGQQLEDSQQMVETNDQNIEQCFDQKSQEIEIISQTKDLFHREMDDKKIASNTSSSDFGLFLSQQKSPELSGFGLQTTEPKDKVSEQKSEFSLFGNQCNTSDTNTKESIFGLFGKSPPEETNPSLGFSFKMFSDNSSNASTDGSPLAQPSKGFSFFK